MIVRVLPQPFERGELGKQQFERSEFVEKLQPPPVPVRGAERGIRSVGGKDPVQLGKNPLGHDVEYVPDARAGGEEGLLFGLKPRFRGEPRQSEHPETVLREHP